MARKFVKVIPKVKRKVILERQASFRGRPGYDLQKISQNLLEWSLKEDSMSFMKFADPYEFTSQDLWEFAQRDAEFKNAYKKARERIAYRREMLMHENKLNYGVWYRYAAMYEIGLKKYESLIADQEAARKRGIIPEEEMTFEKVKKIATGKVTQPVNLQDD